MGRTGTFLASENSGVIGDYYLLSKSLGGAITKISAAMIESSLYNEDFGVIHSSTFAEDEYSAEVALKALDIIDRNNVIFQYCSQKGKYLFNGLQRVKRQYPQIIKDIRGRGLMLGIEFHNFEHGFSPILKTISKQNLLGYLLSGYLLNKYRIRIAPSLSNNNVIRIEPSAYIPINECRRLIVAIRQIAEIIHKQNTFLLLRYLVLDDQINDIEIEDYRHYYVNSYDNLSDESITKVGFVGHSIHPRHVPQFEFSWEKFDTFQIELLMQRLYKVIDPQITHSTIVKSKTGKKIEFNFINFFITPEIISEQMKMRNLSYLREKLEIATQVAIDRGCKVLGFGAMTSIITRNCKEITTNEIAITTGNAYTAAVGIDSLLKVAKQEGLEFNLSSIAL